MTAGTKSILIRSINEFLVATSERKEEMILHVQNELKRHEQALKSIGSENNVQAAKIFLKIYGNE